MATPDPILRVQNATVSFTVGDGLIKAVDDVSLQVFPGETVAVVGESGCGKTTLARAVLGLQPLDSGEIWLGSRQVRGAAAGQAADVGMVWQDPFASIDPQWTIRRVVEEPLRLTNRTTDMDALLASVGLSSELAARYPHQLSGGQRQRAAIARALALNPPLVICDEPTAALDLSIQAQILNLLRDLQRNTGCAFLYISHDLTTVRYLADRVAVMYMGRIVETGPSEEVFERPRHPYTAALLASAPTLDRIGVLPDFAPGEIPNPTNLGPGCRFASRCVRVQDRCRSEDPRLDTGHLNQAACHFPLSAPVTTNEAPGSLNNTSSN